jgi:hypothetical protein
MILPQNLVTYSQAKPMPVAECFCNIRSLILLRKRMLVFKVLSLIKADSHGVRGVVPLKSRLAAAKIFRSDCEGFAAAKNKTGETNLTMLN